MKLLILLLAAVALSSANHHRGNYRSARDINQMVQNLKDKFPQNEWSQFYSKLTEALGTQREDFMKKFQENQGNMDQTLEQFSEKLSAHPMVQEHWNNIKSKWEMLRGTFQETTIQDVLDWIKSKIHNVAPSEYPSFENMNDLWDSMKTHSLAFWNKVAQPTPSRQRRQAAEYNEAITKIKDKFPAEEWNAFWTKLQASLGEHKADFDQKLQENEGKMDLTLKEFGEQITDHEGVKKAYEAVKAKWADASSKVDETTVRDVVEFVKKTLGDRFGDISPERAQEWWATAKDTIIPYWNKLLAGTTY
jgi:2-hydroxy-3-keto-5-methylthiopentenyl-1-phosphate phosphatase